MQQQTAETIKHAADGVAVFTTAGVLLKWLPALAALFTVIWTCWRLYEGWERRRLRVKQVEFYLYEIGQRLGEYPEHYKWLSVEELREKYERLFQID